MEWVQLIVVVIVVFIMWLCVRDTDKGKIAILLSTGLIISYIVAMLASFPPVIEIPLGENEALRTFSPVAYPFCIQQYSDYNARLFSYALILGWPEGIPLVQLPLMQIDTFFFNLARYTTGLYLGLILLLGVVILVGILTVIDIRGLLASVKWSASPRDIFIPLQIILIVMVTPHLLFGSIIYPIGGIFVLIVTLYPIYRLHKDKTS